MKKLYINSLSVAIIGIAGVSSSFASTETNATLPPEFATLTTSQISTLEGLTESERDAYLTSLGISLPTRSGSGDMTQRTSHNRPEMGSGTINENRMARMQARRTMLTNTGNTTPVAPINTTSTTTNVTTTSTERAERIAQNRAKQLEQRKNKIQKKIDAGETLNRLEQKFADANDLEY